MLLAAVEAAALAAPEAEIRAIGADHGRGDLVAAQPWMTSADYATADAFRDRLAASLDAARTAGLLSDRTVVVFPEDVGTWLFAVGEGDVVTGAPTLEDARRAIAHQHVASSVWHWLGSGSRDRATDAMFHVRARDMAAAYDAAFSALASEYHVTIVAGSIVLPRPRVVDGHVVAGRGALEGVSAVYDPDGRAADDLVVQGRPDEAERAYVRPGSFVLPVFDTPIGHLGVLVGADASDPDAWDALAAGGATVVAVPSSTPADGTSMGLDAPDSGVEAGVAVALRGHLWDVAARGPTTSVLGRAVTVSRDADAPAIVAVWLGEEPLSPEASEAAEAAEEPLHPPH